MANIKSAKKRILVSRRQNLRNRMIKSAVKTALKKVTMTVQSGDAAKTEAAYRAAVSLVDKAVVKGVMHKNAAAHKKAQLAALVSAK
ncbi:MAG: 30S ribosomal protein S20 [Clostridia bacterium]|nr:30S ribosomal protein S20 [Clostridia bacterium]